MKKLILILTVIFFLTPIFAQEAEAPELPADQPASSEQTETKAAKNFDFIMQFEPAVYINTESTLVSAPSPVVYPISIGFLWPNYSSFSMQPSLSFFFMYHLMYNERALPAEIENRTATTLSFMLNIPAVYTIYLKNSRFQFNVGAGVFARIGLLSSGVKPNDSGWTGSADSDVNAINSWFWGDLRWFYLTAGTSWLYNLTPKIKAGPTINAYIPVGGLIKDHDVQGMIISLGIKLSL